MILIYHLVSMTIFAILVIGITDKKRFVFTSPLLCFSCGIILFNYLAAIKVSILGTFFSISEETVIKGAFYSTFLNFTYCASLYFSRYVLDNYNLKTNVIIEQRRTYLTGYFILFLSSTAVILYTVTFQKLLLLLSVPVILLACEYRYKNKIKHINFLLASVLIIFLAFSVLYLSRFHYLAILTTILFVGFRLHGRIALWHLVLFVALVIILGSFTKTMTDNDASLNDSLFWVAFGIRLITADFLDSYDNFLYILEYFPDYVDYLYGESLMGSVFTFIPRDIWAAKPIAFGSLIGSAWYPNMTDLSLAPSLHGELYANFGLVGGCLSFWLIGIVVTFFEHISKHTYLSLQYCCSLIFFVLPRGDFLLIDAFYYFIFPYIILLSLFSLRSIKKKKSLYNG